MKNKPYDFADHSATSIENLIMQHLNRQDNPHRVTKEDVQLDRVDNTSDLEKPMSTEQKKYMDKAINAVETKVDDQLELNYQENENLRKDLTAKYDAFQTDVNNHLKQEHDYIEVSLADLRQSIVRSAEEVDRKINVLDNKIDTNFSEMQTLVNDVKKANQEAIVLLAKDLHGQLSIEEQARKDADADLQKQIDNLDEDIDGKLKKLDDKLEAEIEKIDNKLDSEVEQLDNKILDVKKVVNKHTIELVALADEIARIDTKHDKAEQDIINDFNEKLKDLNDKFEAELARHIADYTQLYALIGKHINDYNELVEALASTNDHIDNVEHSVEDLDSKVDRNRAEVDADMLLVEQTLAANSEIVSTILKTVEDMFEAVQSILAVKIPKLENDITTINNELDDVNLRIDNLTSTKMNIIDANQKFEEVNTKIDETKTSLEEQIATEDTKIKNSLATVATTGEYSDLKNIPANLADKDYVQAQVEGYHDDTKEDKFNGITHTLDPQFVDTGYDYNKLANKPDLNNYGKVQGVVDSNGINLVGTDKIARVPVVKISDATVVNEGSSKTQQLTDYVDEKATTIANARISANVPSMITTSATAIAKQEAQKAVDALPEAETNEEADVTDLIASIAGKVGN